MSLLRSSFPKLFPASRRADRARRLGSARLWEDLGPNYEVAVDTFTILQLLSASQGQRARGRIFMHLEAPLSKLSSHKRPPQDHRDQVFERPWQACGIALRHHHGSAVYENILSFPNCSWWPDRVSADLLESVTGNSLPASPRSKISLPIADCRDSNDWTVEDRGQSAQGLKCAFIITLWRPKVLLESLLHPTTRFRERIRLCDEQVSGRDWRDHLPKLFIA